MNINHQGRINIHILLSKSLKSCKLFLQKATILIIFINNYLEFKYLFIPIVINYEILPDTFQQLPRTIILTIQTSLTFKFHHDFEKKKSKTIFQFPGAICYSWTVPGRSRAHFSRTEIMAGTKSRRHCLYEEKFDVRYDCHIKTMFCSSLSPGFIFDLRYLCFFAYNGVQHILCWVFVLFVFVLYFVCPMLSVSLDCPFLIAHTVFSNVYLHCSTSEIHSYEQHQSI